MVPSKVSSMLAWLVCVPARFALKAFSLTLAPCATSALTIPTWPAAHAAMRGVFPFPSAAFAAAPRRRSSSTHLGAPLYDAL